VNTLQTWLLLRPLIVFVVAGPVLVFAALSVLRTKGQEAGHCAEARADASPRFALTAGGVWRMPAERLSQSRSSKRPAVEAHRRAASIPGAASDTVTRPDYSTQ
jgi:hypothetical protein